MIFESGRLGPGKEEDKFILFQSHYLQLYKDNEETKEWISRQWQKCVTAIVRRYSLEEAKTTYRTVNDQVRLLETGVSTGVQPAATARHSQSMKLPAKAEVLPSVRKAANLNRVGLSQSEGNPSSQGIPNNLGGGGYRGESDSQYMAHHVQNSMHGPSQTTTNTVATGGDEKI